MNLTPKQQKFVEEYLVDLNAAAAAKRAGYTAKRADQQGHENLRKPEVAAAIAERQAALRTKTEITQERVINELAKIAFGDQRKVMSWGPGGVAVRASEDLTDDEAAVVAEIAETKTRDGGGSLKLKTHDKVAALKLIGEHLGIFTQKLQVDVGGKVTVYLPENGR